MPSHPAELTLMPKSQTMAQPHIDWYGIYQKTINKAGYTSDSGQLTVIDELSRIDQALNSKAKLSEKKTLWPCLFKTRESSRTSLIKGLYLFGAVGRGKTFLMNLFCQHTTVAHRRIHFHHFMKAVHESLHTIEQQQNPLDTIAAEFAARYRLLCLDEFMVTDITDAMILYSLLKGLSDRGVVIITTTNTKPDDLYKDGLQRARFMPVIALLKERLVIHEITGKQDFRRLSLNHKQRFFYPLNQQSQQQLEHIAGDVSQGLNIERQGTIRVNHRNIAFIAKSQAMIWFSFAEICEGMRSQHDYIELAAIFPVIIISDIPILDQYKEEAARRFLLLIDELYDNRNHLILSAQTAIENIYQGQTIRFEFNRLKSRLYEMQSAQYGL